MYHGKQQQMIPTHGIHTSDARATRQPTGLPGKHGSCQPNPEWHLRLSTGAGNRNTIIYLGPPSHISGNDGKQGVYLGDQGRLQIILEARKRTHVIIPIKHPLRTLQGINRIRLCIGDPCSLHQNRHLNWLLPDPMAKLSVSDAGKNPWGPSSQ